MDFIYMPIKVYKIQFYIVMNREAAANEMNQEYI